jgi:hypothetical protein
MPTSLGRVRARTFLEQLRILLDHQVLLAQDRVGRPLGGTAEGIYEAAVIFAGSVRVRPSQLVGLEKRTGLLREYALTRYLFQELFGQHPRDHRKKCLDQNAHVIQVALLYPSPNARAISNDYG